MNIVTDEELFARFVDAVDAKEECGEERELTEYEFASLLGPDEATEEGSIFGSTIENSSALKASFDLKEGTLDNELFGWLSRLGTACKASKPLCEHQ